MGYEGVDSVSGKGLVFSGLRRLFSRFKPESFHEVPKGVSNEITKVISKEFQGVFR